jgi:VID27 N-terminal region
MIHRLENLSGAGIQAATLPQGSIAIVVYVAKEPRPYEYTLVVQRAYDEEDPKLLEESDEYTEENIFPLNGQLHLRTGEWPSSCGL